MSFATLGKSGKEPYGSPNAIGNDREIYEDFQKM
jgi:hypothetical protein